MGEARGVQQQLQVGLEHPLGACMLGSLRGGGSACRRKGAEGQENGAPRTCVMRRKSAQWHWAGKGVSEYVEDQNRGACPDHDTATGQRRLKKPQSAFSCPSTGTWPQPLPRTAGRPDTTGPPSVALLLQRRFQAVGYSLDVSPFRSLGFICTMECSDPQRTLR